MAPEKEIINKVAASGLITIDLEDYYPHEHVFELDIKDFLYEGIILKEKEFRKSLEEFDWDKEKNKIIAVFCSEDAIIPKWAYMLVAMHASAVTNKIYYGSREQAIEQFIIDSLNKNLIPGNFSDQRIVIKGCGEKNISDKVYLHITQMLLPVVKSMMFGEPCSTVPIYKKKK